jgi:excisionase family DNA binding protein
MLSPGSREGLKGLHRITIMSTRRELSEDPSAQSSDPRLRFTNTATGRLGDRLLTDRDVCAITGLDRVTLYRLRNSKKIGFYKLGKVIRYSPEHVREFLDQHESQPKVPRYRTRG